MTLRDTVTRWHSAMCLLDESRFDEAAQKLLEIQKPSARIFYNLGCICILQHRYREAVQYFNTSIDQDNYLAIAFYQRGLCYYEIQRFDAAKSDFLSARSMIRNAGIDYKQLGAEILLSAQLLDHCIIVTEERSNRKQTDVSIQALPVRDCVLKPQKSLVDNLVKQTFLGNAKVISSAKGEDIVTALETRKSHAPVVKTWTSASVPSSPASSRYALNTSSAKRIFIPPPPKRPPPRLPSGAAVNQELRLKSKSLEDVTVNNVNQSLVVEDKAKIGHNMVSSKPKKPAAFNVSSSVADRLPLREDIHNNNQGRVSPHLLDGSAVRNHVNENVTKRAPVHSNMPDKQTPSRVILNHVHECASLGQREETKLHPGHVSGGHAAQMKLLFESGGKQEKKVSQEDIRLNDRKCRLGAELQETINSQTKRLDVLQQEKTVSSQQNRTNTQQCLSPSSSTVSGSSIQRSQKPARPPPPKFFN